MYVPNRFRASAACCMVFALQPLLAFSQTSSDPKRSPGQVVEQRDGQHDFDFEIGTWKTHLRRLVRPLSGSTAWVEYQGTTVVREALGGRANLVELAVDG